MPDFEEEEGKKKKKKEKKSKQKGPQIDLEEDEEEGFGSKVLLFFVTLIIIAIWLAIIALLIRADVGGFGSSVLYPLLKDVPYVNRILPDVDYPYDPEDTQYAYDSLDAAIARIKELELMLSQAGTASGDDAQLIADLRAQVAELMRYKEEQAAFEKTKEKFYEEVVFSDVAPDIKEYRAYYESIDPQNAEVLYKQVVKQTVRDEEIENYAKTYSAMKPKEAAAIFNTMTNDLDLVARILQYMDTSARAAILGKMDAETAAKVTQILEPRS